MTGKENALDLEVTAEEMYNWQNGMVAQRAFPNLNADEREYIISGIPPGKWETYLGPEV
jgi:hypothetical protein